MDGSHFLAVLGTVIVTLAGVIARLGLHVRDLNQRTAQQAEKHAQAIQTLHADWRGDIRELNQAHSALLLETNRTLDAWLAARREADEGDEDG